MNDISFYRKTGTSNYTAYITSLCVGSLSTNNTTQAKDVLRLYPIVISKPTTITSIGVKITAGGTAGSVIRLGLYKSVNNLPTECILDAGTVPGDAIAFATIACNITLEPGLYFMAQNNNCTASYTCVAVAGASTIPILGHTNTNSTSSSITYLSCASVYGTLPPDLSATTMTPQTIGHQLIYLGL